MDILFTLYMNQFNKEFLTPDQTMTMVIVPILTSSFTIILQSLFNDCRNGLHVLFMYIYKKISETINEKILKTNSDICELYIPIINTTSNFNTSSEDVVVQGIPMLWYLNKHRIFHSTKLKSAKIHDACDNMKTMLQSISMYTPSTASKQPSIQQIEQCFYIPYVNEHYQQQSQNSKSTSILDTVTQSSVQQTSETKTDDFDNLVEIAPDIKMSVEKQYVLNGNSTQKIQTVVILKSKKKSVYEIGKFYESVKEEYNKEISNKSGKLYIYNGKHCDQKFGCYDLDSSQSFDNIFLENKDQIIKDILNLEDVEYYQKFGMKRKIGHLYVGPPGSGKTCFVTAMAKLTGRSVVYIPISRIRSNEELQSIIYERSFGGLKYKMNEVIFIADEIDSIGSSALLKSNNINEINENSTDEKKSVKEQTIIINTNDEKSKSTTNQQDSSFDKLNIGMVLNILDGNNDQDGMIFIGTANSCDKLDPAIYRNGRLKLIKFQYVGRNEISQMIEHYYEIKLTTEQHQKIRNDKTVQSLNIKNLCLKYVESKNQTSISIDDLIDEINYMFDHVEDVNEKKCVYIPQATNNINLPKLPDIPKTHLHISECF